MMEWINSSSFLILAIIILRSLFRRKISRRMQYALWGIVLIRLLLPFQFGESTFSIQNFIGQSHYTYAPSQDSMAENGMKNAETDNLPNSPQDNIPVSQASALDNTQDNVQSNTSSQVSSPESQKTLPEQVKNRQFTNNQWPYQESTQKLLKIIWLIGSILSGIWIIIANLHFYNRLRKNRKIYKYDNCPLPAYITDQVVSPCLFGLVAPSIYLTRKAIDGETHTEYVINHELCHFHYRDHIWSLLRGICLAIWWWNPLVWIAAMYSRHDCELACDEACIGRLGEENRISYGETIINMISTTQRMRIFSGATMMTAGKSGIKDRLKILVKTPRVIRPLTGIVLLAVTAAVFLSFTGEKTDSKTSEDISAQTIAAPSADSEIVPDAENISASEENEDWKTSIGEQVPLPEDHLTLPIEASTHQETQEELTLRFHDWQKEGTGCLNVRSIDKSTKVIDRYIISKPDFIDYDYSDELLPFSEDCEFFINYQVGQIKYTPVTFDLFADTIGSHKFEGKRCDVEFKDGEIIKAYLTDPYDGISYDEHSPYDSYSYDLYGLETTTLVSAYETELDRAEGLETIKVYVGNMEDGDMGYVVVENKEEEPLFIGFAHLARACWNSIYLGEVDGEAYLFTLHIENRDNYGGVSYQAFRLDGKGGVNLLSGAAYDYHEETFNESLFFKWAEPMNYYLKNCFLLLSTQDGELRYSPDHDFEKYKMNVLSKELQAGFSQ